MLTVRLDVSKALGDRLPEKRGGMTFSETSRDVVEPYEMQAGPPGYCLNEGDIGRFTLRVL